MADHSRALAFCIHENVRPGPEKQGYVIRRLLRRAVLDAYQMGRREPFLHEITPVVAEVMGRGYPELKESVRRIQTTIRQEEEQFLRNLENGLRRLDDVFRKTTASGSDTIAGRDAFDLHATYGIPVEVVESLATDHNLRVDRTGFEAELKKHAEVSRVTKDAADVFAAGPLDTLKKEYRAGSEFLGYATTRDEGRVIGILEQGRLAESAEADGGASIALVLDRTPFYGEAGGQVGDTGTIRGDRFAFRVLDTKKDHDFILHIGRVAEGRVTVQEKVQAEVDADRREAIRRAHTATHLLHHALRTVLGQHAQQAGSKVEPDRLRFDFGNPEALGRERLRTIEDMVNERVLSAAPVSWSHMPIEQARAQGAMALFGEKYP
ncbi:MAG TPA: alanine--tRNA ligase-related protein, partial [Acidimicrobiales bacterium]|nr:alanine--tRNA ligase-related protein [Acidimicrobiales bacterium]